MDEHVFAAILAGDEAEPFGVVEPFHLSGDRNGGRRIRRNPARAPKAHKSLESWKLTRPVSSSGRNGHPATGFGRAGLRLTPQPPFRLPER